MEEQRVRNGNDTVKNGKKGFVLSEIKSPYKAMLVKTM